MRLAENSDVHVSACDAQVQGSEPIGFILQGCVQQADSGGRIPRVCGENLGMQWLS